MLCIEYPTITVGERTLVVRYSIAAQVIMKRRGCDPKLLKELLDPANPAARDNLLVVFSAMVAENFLDAKPEAFSFDGAPTAEYWMAQIEPQQIFEVDRVIAESMGKVSEALKATAPPPRLKVAS